MGDPLDGHDPGGRPMSEITPDVLRKLLDSGATIVWGGDPDQHCSSCGNRAETHADDSYTQCCNKLICHGDPHIYYCPRADKGSDQ